MAKKKLLESIVDFIDKPAKEIKKIKRKKQFDKRMKDLKSKDQKSIKSKEKRDEIFSDKAITKRRKERERSGSGEASRRADGRVGHRFFPLRRIRDGETLRTGRRTSAACRCRYGTLVGADHVLGGNFGSKFSNTTRKKMESS